MDMTQFIRNGPESAQAQVVLAHGAGAPMDSPFMKRFAEGLAKEGIGVTRFEFPYMQQRRTERKKTPSESTINLVANMAFGARNISRSGVFGDWWKINGRADGQFGRG